MPVSPIDYGRYGHPEMVTVFEEEKRHELWLTIEATVAETQAEMEIIPREAAQDIKKTATPDNVTLERTLEIEQETRHDIVALFQAVAEKCTGPGSRWVHFGLTSNDIKDTALGLQLKAAFEVIMPQVDNLCETLLIRAQETQDLIAVGRSHGQHAVPITYGIRFSVWLDEMNRHKKRLQEARMHAVVGKIAGATGSHTALGPQGIKLQEKVLQKLGLNEPIATTQIIQRDRHAEAVMVLANLASSIDKIATDFRNLQRTEIAEISEPFARDKQVGSSAMPHKRNPVTCEKLSGIARIVRSLVSPSLENVVSWEERDISHSSTERFIIPQAFILTDYLVRELERVISGLEIHAEAVENNLKLSNEAILSEYIVTLLTKSGLERPKAHEKLRALSSQARDSKRGLLETIQNDSEISGVFDTSMVSLDEYYNNIREVSKSIVSKAERAYHQTLE